MTKHNNVLIEGMNGNDEEAMNTDWDFEFGEPVLWTVAPRLMLPPRELVAHIHYRHDAHFREIAQVTQLSHGRRRHKTKGYEDSVVLAHLVTSGGDHGVWYIAPTMASKDGKHDPQYGFHPAPRLYFRRGCEDPLFPAMQTLGVSLRDLREQCTLTGKGTHEQNRASFVRDYETLFAESVPRIDQNSF